MTVNRKMNIIMNVSPSIRRLTCLVRPLTRSLCSVTQGESTNLEEMQNNPHLPTETPEKQPASFPIFDTSLLDGPSKKWRERRDPKTTSVILFPGFGSQRMGMGECLLDFPNVPEMFEVANRVLGYDLLDICLNGDRNTINRTDIAEAAIFVTSLATAEKLRFERPTAIERCVAAAGFSIGELTALVFAGSIDFEEALRLVKIRGQEMMRASEEVPSGMMTIIYGADGRVGLALKAASEWCIRKGIDPYEAACSISYYMFPHCKVIGGHEEALQFIEANKTDFGIKRCTRLPARGAFHTKLMKEAARVFAEALNKTRVSIPRIPVMSNVTARPMKSEAAIRESLSGQMFQAAKLEQILHALYSRPQGENLPYSFECGPGTSMLNILEKVNYRARRQCVSVYS